MQATLSWDYVEIVSGKTARYAVLHGYVIAFESNDPDAIVARIRRNPQWRLGAEQAADWNCDDLAEVRA